MKAPWIASLLLLCSASTHAIPLFELTALQSGGRGGGNDPMPPLAQPEDVIASIGLAFDLEVGTFPDGRCPFAVAIGCMPYLDANQTGTFEFNAANSPGFGDFVSRLIGPDRESEEFWTFSYFFSPGYDGSPWIPGPFQNGGGQGLSLAGLYEGEIEAIDFIRVTIDVHEYTMVPEFEGAFYRTAAIYEFWGTPGAGFRPADPHPVPEPATTGLMLLGLAAIALARRTRC